MKSAELIIITTSFTVVVSLRRLKEYQIEYPLLNFNQSVYVVIVTVVIN